MASCLMLSIGSCSTIAQWAAPDKIHKPSHKKEYKLAEKFFWSSFHGGKYKKIPDLLYIYKKMYNENPNNYKVAARLGFIHTWALSERRRLKKIGPTIIDHASLCKKYFTEAYGMKKDARYRGFLASCILAEAEIHKDERNTRRGFFMMKDAIDDWPEFNYFTGGYVLANQEWNSDLFQLAIDWQWENLDECTGEKVDRENPDYSSYMAMDVKKGIKRVCWNSKKAPHNFEGFFMNMGDLLVKKGQPDLAKKIYNNAKLSKTYKSWPFKKNLEERIKNAESNVSHFKKTLSAGDHASHPVIMFNTTYSCMACHQKK
mgnify:FL=1